MHRPWSKTWVVRADRLSRPRSPAGPLLGHAGALRPRGDQRAAWRWLDGGRKFVIVRGGDRAIDGVSHGDVADRSWMGRIVEWRPTPPLMTRLTLPSPNVWTPRGHHPRRTFPCLGVRCEVSVATHPHSTRGAGERRQNPAHARSTQTVVAIDIRDVPETLRDSARGTGSGRGTTSRSAWLADAAGRDAVTTSGCSPTGPVRPCPGSKGLDAAESTASSARSGSRRWPPAASPRAD